VASGLIGIIATQRLRISYINVYIICALKGTTDFQGLEKNFRYLKYTAERDVAIQGPSLPQENFNLE
jgi:hypothetical protein